MESPQYHQFGSSDSNSLYLEPKMMTQKGVRNKLFYILYGIVVLLLLILLLVTGIKLSWLDKQIADVKLHLEEIRAHAVGTAVENVYVEKTDPVRGQCKEGWVSFQSRCYLLSTSTVAWSEAEQQCRTHGAHLLVLNNIEELDYISKIIEVKHSHWIGLVEREHEGHWTWVDGTDINSTPMFWDMDQPDNWALSVNGEDCGQLHGSVKRIRKLLNDADCSLRYRYICETRT